MGRPALLATGTRRGETLGTRRAHQTMGPSADANRRTLSRSAASNRPRMARTHVHFSPRARVSRLISTSSNRLRRARSPKIRQSQYQTIIDIGILHQRSRPGCPQDNGAHERMHRTLKRHAITRLPWALPRQDDHPRRDVPLSEPTALPRECDGRPRHRIRRNRRWDLGDPLQQHPPRDVRRTGLHHHGVA